MALPRYTGTTNYIAQLDDLPNDEGGLSADQLKAEFDKGLTEKVAWDNDTLVPAIEAEIAEATADKASTADLSDIRHRQYLGV
jgi:hypothetical protein